MSAAQSLTQEQPLTGVDHSEPAPMIPISWGELFDKITILELKSERLHCPRQLTNVRLELKELHRVRDRYGRREPAVEALAGELRIVNERLWDLENTLRALENAQRFSSEFVEAARGVYRTNDVRSSIKRRINELTRCRLVEEKSYAV